MGGEVRPVDPLQRASCYSRHGPMWRDIAREVREAMHKSSLICVQARVGTCKVKVLSCVSSRMERMRDEVRAIAPIANAIADEVAVRRHCGAPTQPHRSTAETLLIQ
jgi:hypothetical protein